MKKIQVVPKWSFRDSDGNHLNPQLFSLLRAIHDTGKLTAATEQIGISYRHGWNLLHTCTAIFGLPLVELQKGKGAKITALGEKLLWAEQRVIARLEPQLESLASELNLEIHRSLEGVNPMLRLHASHGYAVALLPEYSQKIQLDLQYKSAEEALSSLNRGRCDLAGFHLPVATANKKAFKRYSGYLKPRVHKIIKFITRQQGLIVKEGNPLAFQGLEDLRRPEVKFINRQKDSGTRALFDEMLQQETVNAQQINGYEDEEFTHSAVAAYVASGMADVGFGIEAAARQFNLHFIPIAAEYYLFACHSKTLNSESCKRFLQSIRSDEFQTAVKALPGYSPENCGEVCTVDGIIQD